VFIFNKVEPAYALFGYAGTDSVIFSPVKMTVNKGLILLRLWTTEGMPFNRNAVLQKQSQSHFSNTFRIEMLDIYPQS